MSDGIQRRDFLKVVGVGGAGAGLAGCSTQNVEKLIPYVVPPEEITPGVATWYATTCGECSAGCGVWVRTREGRAVKLEGNPSHPISQGALCAQGHSSLQALYHPDRLSGPMRRSGDTFEPIGWDEAEALLAEQLRDAGGNAVLLHGHLGPAMSAAAAQVMNGVGGSTVEFDTLSVSPLREATRIAFGRGTVPIYDIESARMVVSFGADFIGGWMSPVEHGRAFASMSHADERGSKGKLVFVGPRLSLTGQNADEWIPIRPGSESVVALAMASVIAGVGGDAGPYASLLRSYDVAGAAAQAGVSADAIEALARSFMSDGPSLAIGPGPEGNHEGATAAHLAVLVLNAVAGNVGRTVHVNGTSAAPTGSVAEALRAVGRAAGGVVMVHGANPMYSLPPGSGFAEAYANAGFRVSFAQTMDETAATADLILPDRHALESWGDANPRDDTWSIQQPAMQAVPLFDSKQTGDVLMSVGARLGIDFGGATTFFEFLQGRWREAHATIAGVPPFEEWWRAVLRSGVATSVAPRAAEATPLQAPDTALTFEPATFEGDGEYYLTVYPSLRFGDGRFSNRPWLQELPDPVSKVMWQSWVEIHPSAADEMGLRNGSMVRVTSGSDEVEVPVFTYPGIRPDVVALATGGGHTSYGQFADGNGVNAVTLLSGDTEGPSGALIYAGTRVSVTPTGDWRRLATTEGSSDTHDRPIAPAIALSGLGHEEEHAEEEGHGPLKELQLWGGFGPVETEGDERAYPLPGIAEYAPYDGGEATPRWAMAIDLDKCTGCSACVVACQAENNVAFVGEDQVLMGREMHWMRIERYYETVDAEHAGPVDIRHLPMLCQHCGNAPCEPVCPVYAAYHTPDGLNAQIYNRCVGTRYCANNCPYKVRVFNWYRYTAAMPEPLNWQFNPDVTVRDNGVMEKCTFCVQRIRDAENLAAISGHEISDGEIIPACQQSCPAEAIVFGNIRDENARVSQVTRNERTYKVLDELINTQPAVSYLKKVTFHDVQAPEH